MKVIASLDGKGEKYLVDTGDGWYGFVADFVNRIRYIDLPIQSIAKEGYWKKMPMRELDDGFDVTNDQSHHVEALFVGLLCAQGRTRPPGTSRNRPDLRPSGSAEEEDR